MDDHVVYVNYTVKELLDSEELRDSLIGGEIGWVVPSVGHGAFRFNGKIFEVDANEDTLFVWMEDSGVFHLSSGEISVR